MTKTDPPAKTTPKKSAATPPSREREKDDWSLYERCFLASLQGLASQAEMPQDGEDGYGDWYADDAKALERRDKFLVGRAIDIARLAVEALHEERATEAFNAEV